MASTNKTTNYELSQFVETDRPAWLTDYNGDMRTIDSTMKAISDVASGASGSISELADRMSTAEGNISTNANDIDALEARADSLEAQAQSTSGTIANIQTEQTAQNLGIEAATELGYNLARPYDSASTYAVGDYVLFQNTLYKCITAVSVGEAFDPTKWLAIKATDEIAAGGYTLPTASASTLGGVKVGNGLSIDAAGVLSPNFEYNSYDAINGQQPYKINTENVQASYHKMGAQSGNSLTVSNPTGGGNIFVWKLSNIVIIKIVASVHFTTVSTGSSDLNMGKVVAALLLNDQYEKYNELLTLFNSLSNVQHIDYEGIGYADEPYHVINYGGSFVNNLALFQSFIMPSQSVGGGTAKSTFIATINNA